MHYLYRMNIDKDGLQESVASPLTQNIKIITADKATRTEAANTQDHPAHREEQGREDEAAARMTAAALKYIESYKNRVIEQCQAVRRTQE